jgi:hypothetical protein
MTTVLVTVRKAGYHMPVKKVVAVNSHAYALGQGLTADEGGHLQAPKAKPTISRPFVAATEKPFTGQCSTQNYHGRHKTRK